MTSQQSLQERLRDMHWRAASSCDPEFNEVLLEAAEAIDAKDALIAKAAIALQQIHDEWELGGACCAATAADALAKLKAAGHTS